MRARWSVVFLVVTACGEFALVDTDSAGGGDGERVIATPEPVTATSSDASVIDADAAASDAHDAGDATEGAAIRVAQGVCHGCAWRAGRAFCWGANKFGALGDGTRTSRSIAGPVVGLGDIATLAVGCGNPDYFGHTCAVTATGDVWCWGANSSGQIGDGTNEDRLKPVHVQTLPPIASIALGAAHSCAVALDGRVFCWGHNQSLQLGDNTALDRSWPVPVAVSDAVEIAAGHFHTCARHASGKISCWGPNSYGELGNGTRYAEPKPAVATSFTDVVQLVAGGFHTCVRRVIGGAWCWGNGEYGTLGHGLKPVAQTTPVQVQLSFVPTEIGANKAMCARSATGVVSCWGPQFTVTGDFVMPSTPVPVATLSDAVRLDGQCAARAGDRVSCWGFNQSGQIGDGTTSNRGSPSDVIGLAWEP